MRSTCLLLRLLLLPLLACGTEEPTTHVPIASYVERAQDLLDTHPNEAIRLSQLGIEAGEPGAHALMARALLRIGDTSNAIRPLEIAHERGEDVWELLAQTYERVDRHDDALRLYDSVVAESRDALRRAGLAKARILLPRVEAAATQAVQHRQTRASRRDAEPDVEALHDQLAIIDELLMERPFDATLDEARELDERVSKARQDLDWHYADRRLRLTSWDTEAVVQDRAVASALAPSGQVEANLDPCFAEARSRQRVEARLTVSPDGTMNQVELDGAEGDLASCIAEVLHQRRFPRNTQTYVVTGVYERTSSRRRHGPRYPHVYPRPIRWQ